MIHLKLLQELENLEAQAAEYLAGLMPEIEPGQRLKFNEPVQPDDNDDRYIITGLEPDSEYGIMAHTEDDGYKDTCPVQNYELKPAIYLIERLETKAYTITI